MAWEAQVIRDLGMLSELDKGRQVLDAAKTQGKEITITPTDKQDNYAQGGTVHFDPGATSGRGPSPATTIARRSSGLGRSFTMPSETCREQRPPRPKGKPLA